MARYEKIKTGMDGWCDWQSPLHGHGRRNYRMACCDCGLVHEMQFRAVTKKSGRKDVVFRVKRNNRATAATRRGKQHTTLRDDGPARRRSGAEAKAAPRP